VNEKSQPVWETQVSNLGMKKPEAWTPRNFPTCSKRAVKRLKKVTKGFRTEPAQFNIRIINNQGSLRGERKKSTLHLVVGVEGHHEEKEKPLRHGARGGPGNGPL